jgi:hypothetical protein
MNAESRLDCAVTAEIPPIKAVESARASLGTQSNRGTAGEAVTRKARLGSSLVQ